MMTITSYLNRTAGAAGNGVTTTFSFGFPIVATSDLKVMTRAADGTESVKVLNSDFSVSPSPWTTGGSITMLVAPAAGVTLVIIRDVPLTQSLALANGGPLPADTANGAFDRITMFCQRIYELATRSIVLRDTDTMGSGKLDAGTNEIINVTAGTASTSAATVGQVQAVVAASGNVPTPVLGDVGKPLRPTAAGAFSWGTIASSVISDATAAGIAVLSAATAALQRTALGLGTSAVIDVGTTASKVVQLDGSAKLPSVDASALFNIGNAAGGRLSITTAVPVPVASVNNAGTVYYTPYRSQYCPIYDGTNWLVTNLGGELSNVLANSATGKAGPAACANNSNYDQFVWNDSGTPRLTRGPAWTSDTARGAGAGTTELIRVNGIYLNAIAITNGPAAQRGTYVGTIRTNGTATTDWHYGSNGTGGVASIIGIWNMYNRVNISCFVSDDTDSWAYSTATLRPSNNSAAMRVSFVYGLAEDAISATWRAFAATTVVTTVMTSAIGFDVTNAVAVNSVPDRAAPPAVNTPISQTAFLERLSSIGFHFIQALEHATAVTTTWYGDNGSATLQNGLMVRLRA